MLVGVSVVMLWLGSVQEVDVRASSGPSESLPALSQSARLSLPPSDSRHSALMWNQGMDGAGRFEPMRGASAELAGVFGLVGFGLGHFVIGDNTWAPLFLGIDLALSGAGGLVGALTGPALLPVGLAIWLVLHLPQGLDAYLKALGGRGFLPVASERMVIRSGRASEEAFSVGATRVFGLAF